MTNLYLDKIKQDIREALDRHKLANRGWHAWKTCMYGLRNSRVTFPLNRQIAIYDGLYGYAEAEINDGEICAIRILEKIGS
ncbi:hypothetical protein JIR001_06070 [Polycladomyces abyssicola]|uniref:Uncharacterized protein n=1 Tax=Polycladomyces abyssicola TaxID=1125966 RepID=A0A8D5UD38_9BACL|nr:hypothetical protein [Polycladomyces abyssicola]BCU80824.1 hypothetical protein JIR001_06070 [Polycladomyces abyssicola]